MLLKNQERNQTGIAAIYAHTHKLSLVVVVVVIAPTRLVNRKAFFFALRVRTKWTKAWEGNPNVATKEPNGIHRHRLKSSWAETPCATTFSAEKMIF